MKTDTEKRTIAVTGANGFIGNHLVKYFAEHNWNVLALQRTPDKETQKNITYVPYSLSSALDDKVLSGIDWLVHSAYQPYNTENKDADRINRKGTEELIHFCRQNNIKLIFLSSFSAHDEAESHYGKNKLELEGLFDDNTDCVLRLGLVLGIRGLFADIVSLMKKSIFIPLIDNGFQPVQILLVDDLCRVIENVIHAELSGKYNVATAEVYKLKDVYQRTAEQMKLKRVFIPFPLILLQLIVSIIELLKIPLGISNENVLGLKHMRAFQSG